MKDWRKLPVFFLSSAVFQQLPGYPPIQSLESIDYRFHKP